KETDWVCRAPDSSGVGPVRRTPHREKDTAGIPRDNHNRHWLDNSRNTRASIEFSQPLFNANEFSNSAGGTYFTRHAPSSLAVNQNFAVLILDAYRDLFRNDAAFEKFISLFGTATDENGIAPVVAKNHHLATVMSPKQARELLAARILDRIVEKPGLLDE